MSPNLLVLGGTTEASALCKALAKAGIAGTVSLAGRVKQPVAQALPQRVGGFGGIDGLVQYLRDHQITHVVDATHPFAAQMSHHAVAACAKTGVPLIALTRAPWVAGTGDRWEHVADIPAAVQALDRPGCCVFLAVGRMHLDEFAPNPQHRYVLRLVDQPQDALPFPSCVVEVDRGPFTVDNDLALLRRYGVDLIVSKNAGGTGAMAKLTAARQLGVPVLMIDRPPLPDRQEVHGVDDVVDWVTHASAHLGV